MVLNLWEVYTVCTRAKVRPVRTYTGPSSPQHVLLWFIWRNSGPEEANTGHGNVHQWPISGCHSPTKIGDIICGAQYKMKMCALCSKIMKNFNTETTALNQVWALWAFWDHPGYTLLRPALHLHPLPPLHLGAYVFPSKSVCDKEER